jgi:hypothetical protein
MAVAYAAFFMEWNSVSQGKTMSTSTSLDGPQDKPVEWGMPRRAELPNLKHARALLLDAINKNRSVLAVIEVEITELEQCGKE